ncbi:MAG: Fur family transcriptional regulator [Smithella sp.]
MDTEKKNTKALLALKKAGISKTSQRLAVLDALLQSAKPLNANTIRQSLKAKASIDKVTIYRILSLFKKRGIVREIASAGGANYFEVVSKKNPAHPHFNCRNCGEFTCIDTKFTVKMPDSILLKDDYSIEHIEINVSGLCSDCRDTMKSELSKPNNGKEG